MDMVVRVAGLAIIVVVWTTLLRGRVPELSVVMVLAFTTVAVGAALSPLGDIVATFGRLNRATGATGAYLQVVLRSVAIAYVAGFAAQLCRDAGQDSVGMTVELVGKVAVLVTALPVFVALLDTLWRLLPPAG